VITPTAPSSQFGVYIHIPFCAKRCDYCAFATWTDRGHLVDRYLDELAAEIRRAALPPVTSVFVGGGTPTSVPPAKLGAVLAEVPVVAGAEITVECNPDDVTAEMIRTFRDCGVNRVSIGVQSMVDEVLTSLGRTHVPANVERAVEAVVAAGMPTFNLDLIYGAAGETLTQWQATLDGTLRLAPAHISAYALTIEAGTPLATQPERHPDDDDLADKYELADTVLTAAGLVNYEVSNWARPGHECRHNMLYWRQGNYRGFGCAAHSHCDGRRWWNVRTPERYIALAAAGEPTEAAGEDLDDATRRIEGLQLSLRTSDGVPADVLDATDLDGLIEPFGQRVRLTRAGRLLANEVAMRLH
jgi:putative oxygen-independent coproporphyrinogen III oxidase